jgi:hypothetical protein
MAVLMSNAVEQEMGRGVSKVHGGAAVLGPESKFCGASLRWTGEGARPHVGIARGEIFIALGGLHRPSILERRLC